MATKRAPNPKPKRNFKTVSNRTGLPLTQSKSPYRIPRNTTTKCKPSLVKMPWEDQP